MKHQFSRNELAYGKEGYRIFATEGTSKYFQEKNIPTYTVGKIGGEHDLLSVIQKGEVQLVVNTMTKGKIYERDGFQIRRESVENGIPCLTSLDTANALADVIDSMTFKTDQM